jgi:hypothetical protein
LVQRSVSLLLASSAAICPNSFEVCVACAPASCSPRPISAPNEDASARMFWYASGARVSGLTSGTPV